jgi:hypothetical protein
MTNKDNPSDQSNLLPSIGAREPTDNVGRVLKLLFLIAKPPADDFNADWLRRSYEGPMIARSDIMDVTGTDEDDVDDALALLEAAGFLRTSIVQGVEKFALKRTWSPLFEDVEAHGWTKFGRTLLKVLSAQGEWIDNTNQPGLWELQDGDFIETVASKTMFDTQYSRAREKGFAALKVLNVYFPVVENFKSEAVAA